MEEERLATYLTTAEGLRRLEDFNARKQKYAIGIHEAISKAINKWKTNITKQLQLRSKEVTEVPESISDYDEDDTPDAHCDILLGGRKSARQGTNDSRLVAAKKQNTIRLSDEQWKVIIELYK